MVGFPFTSTTFAPGADTTSDMLMGCGLLVIPLVVDFTLMVSV
jgi:hypothetical protein